jgi:hypothetical protein
MCKQIHQSIKNKPLYTYNNINDMNAFMNTTNDHTLLYRVIPDIIRDNIESSDKIGRTYTFTLHGHTITVYLVFPKPSSRNTEYSRIYSSEDLTNTFFESCIHKIIVWLGIALPFSGKTCAKDLSCYFFLTDHVKILPNNSKSNNENITNANLVLNSSTTAQVINKKHVNTAFTTTCSPNSTIMLYRMEEWFKVFIHETFHSLGLDFSQMNTSHSNKQIVTLFPGCTPDMNVRVYETYCETWAELWNVLFVVYFSETQKHTKPRVFTKHASHPVKHKTLRRTIYSRNIAKLQRTSFSGVSSYSFRFASGILHNIISKTEEMIQNERAFSMYQAVKVLHYSGFTYSDCLKRLETSNPFSESIPIFSYYIVKNILLYHINDFIEWCNINNGHATIMYFRKTNHNIREYSKLVGRLYKTDDFIKKMDTMTNYYNQYTLEKPNTSSSELRSSEFPRIPFPLLASSKGRNACAVGTCVSSHPEYFPIRTTLRMSLYDPPIFTE